MKQGILSFSDVRRVRGSPDFVFCAAMLLCGILAGLFTGMHIPQNEQAYMNTLAELLNRDMGEMTVQQAVLCGGGIAAWGIAVLVVGCGRGRALWIAIIVAARGFLLAFAASAAVIQYGTTGIWLSLVTTGVPALAALPALLLLGAVSMEAGRRSGSNGYWAALGYRKEVLAACVLLLAAAIVWRLVFTPLLAPLSGLLGG